MANIRGGGHRQDPDPVRATRGTASPPRDSAKSSATTAAKTCHHASTTPSRWTNPFNLNIAPPPVMRPAASSGEWPSGHHVETNHRDDGRGILGSHPLLRVTGTYTSNPWLPSNRNSIYLVFYSRFLSRGRRWIFLPSLSASHFFLNFEKAVRFHPFFASYFILHNNYIRILAIYRYKSF